MVALHVACNERTRVFEGTTTVPAAHSALITVVLLRFVPAHMPAPTERRLGRNGPSVQCLGFGAAWVTKIPDSQAMGAVEAAWNHGTRYFDTAPWYGKGLSEHRLGLVSLAAGMLCST